MNAPGTPTMITLPDDGIVRMPSGLPSIKGPAVGIESPTDTIVCMFCDLCFVMCVLVAGMGDRRREKEEIGSTDHP